MLNAHPAQWMKRGPLIATVRLREFTVRWANDRESRWPAGNRIPMSPLTLSVIVLGLFAALANAVGGLIVLRRQCPERAFPQILCLLGAGVSCWPRRCWRWFPRLAPVAPSADRC